MVSVRVPAVTVCAENVYAATERLACVLLKIRTQSVGPMVTDEYTSEADGVQNAVVPEEVGAVALVTVIPVAVYPAPVTSPVAVYAVVVALIVADDKYRAARNVSAPVPPRETVVPKA
jgi:hypothetical protein